MRQLRSGGAGVTGLVKRFAVPVIFTAAHVAMFFVAVLTGPASELIGVIP